MPRSASDSRSGAERHRERALALVVLGLLLLGYPLADLLAPSQWLLGVPGPVLYLFGSWALLIALIALLAERGSG